MPTAREWLAAVRGLPLFLFGFAPFVLALVFGS
jgi:hypothetical protein